MSIFFVSSLWDTEQIHKISWGVRSFLICFYNNVAITLTTPPTHLSRFLFIMSKDIKENLVTGRTSSVRKIWHELKFCVTFFQNSKPTQEFLVRVSAMQEHGKFGFFCQIKLLLKVPAFKREETSLGMKKKSITEKKGSDITHFSWVSFGQNSNRSKSDKMQMFIIEYFLTYRLVYMYEAHSSIRQLKTRHKSILILL